MGEFDKLVPEALTFLNDLSANNSRDWFTANKARYDAAVKAPALALGDEIAARLETRKGAAPKVKLFRPQRDVRFSKDKTPYKSSVSGVLTPNGTKAEMAGMVYVEMNASGGWVAGGFYKLPTAQLGLFRQRIIDEPDAFQTVLDGLSGAGMGLADVDRLTRMPKGFSEHEEHPFAEDIKRKSFIIRADVPMDAWLNGDVAGIVADLSRTVGPLIKFGKTALA